MTGAKTLKKLAFVFFLAIFLGSFGNAAAQGYPMTDPNQIRMYYSKQFPAIKKAAERGDAVAQCDLGFCYANGLGTPINREKAFYWTMESAKRGYSHAQGNIGIFFMQGIGTKIDLEKAIYWFQLAAQQGNIAAINNLRALMGGGNSVMTGPR